MFATGKILLLLKILECECLIHRDIGIIHQSDTFQEHIFVMNGPMVVKEEDHLILEERF
jgi:hypothetical protein